MIFVEDEHCYSDIEAVWQDICQMQTLEGVGALIQGLHQLRDDLFWQQLFTESDLLLRIFNHRAREINAIGNQDISDITWLKELVLIIFVESSMAYYEYRRGFPNWNLDLVESLFLFFRDNKPLAFNDVEDDSLNEGMLRIAASCIDLISKKEDLPSRLTVRLCQEVAYVSIGIAIPTSSYYLIAPFIIKHCIENDVFFTVSDHTSIEQWTVSSFLDLCESKNMYTAETAFLRHCLHNEEVKKMLAEEIGL